MAVAEVNRSKVAAGAFSIALVVAVLTGTAYAQANPWPDFFQLEQPGHAEATLFGGGFGSDKYGTIQEGFQLEQSLTRYIGVFGRASGYQLWIGQGFASPLNPTAGAQSRLNFGRFQGGIDFAPWQGTHLFVSGGHDVADSDAYIVEGDLSSWLLLHSMHPVNFSFSALHDYQNDVTSAEIDLQAIVLSKENYMVLAGGGGAVYGGGFIDSVSGQGGPDLGFYYRPWGFGVTAQAGYGVAHQYGQLSIFKQFSWTE
jgi:hypothetical protein